MASRMLKNNNEHWRLVRNKMKTKLPQMNIAVIKKKRKETITKIRLHLDRLEMLESQEEDYRERKKILNLKQNGRRKID